MRFRTAAEPTQNDHIIAGSELPPLPRSFHLFQTSGSADKTPTSFYSAWFLLAQLTAERDKYSSGRKASGTAHRWEGERAPRWSTTPFRASRGTLDSDAHTQPLPVPTYGLEAASSK